MKKQIRKLLFFTVIILTIGCKHDTTVPQIGDSINQTIKNFPELNTSKKVFGNDYKFVRSVKDGQFDF